MSMDSKDRLTLPAQIRKELSSKVCLAPLEGRVLGFTPEGYEAYVNSFFEQDGEHYNPRKRDDERLKSYMTSLAETVEVDSAGRIALGKLNGTRRKVDASEPSRLEKLGLSGEVTVVGTGDHFEIWNCDAWEENQRSVEEDLESLLHIA